MAIIRVLLLLLGGPEALVEAVERVGYDLNINLETYKPWADFYLFLCLCHVVVLNLSTRSAFRPAER